MMDGQDQEGPSSGALGDDGEEAWVDGTEGVVMDAACDGHAIIAALLGGGLAKHVAELGAAVLRTPCHLEEEGEGRGGKAYRSHFNSSHYDGQNNVLVYKQHEQQDFLE